MRPDDEADRLDRDLERWNAFGRCIGVVVFAAFAAGIAFAFIAWLCNHEDRLKALESRPAATAKE